MADKKESNEDILRAILEKGGAKAKEQVAQQLAPKETTPEPTASPTTTPAVDKPKKTRKGVAGSISNTKYYYGPNGSIVDKDGKPAPDRIAEMLKKKDEMAGEVRKSIVSKSLRKVEGEINKSITRTSRLVKVQENIYAKTPAIFNELEKTIQNLTQQHETIVRQLVQQNQDLQDKVNEILTGQKAPTRAGGAVPSKRSSKSASRVVGGSRAAKTTPSSGAYQKARITKPAAVKARQEAMVKAREEQTQGMVKKGAIIGVGVGAAAGVLGNILGGSQNPPPSGGPASAPGPGPTYTGGGTGGSPPPTPSGTGGLVNLQTRGLNGGKARSYQVSAQYAANFKGFVDELENAGYTIKDIGGYRPSAMQHGSGLAIDINPVDNPMLIKSSDGRIVNKLTGQESSNLKDSKYRFGYGKDNFGSIDVSSMAAKWGLGWGGNWKSSSDTMHFSIGGGEGGTGTIAQGATTSTAEAPSGAPTPAAAPSLSSTTGAPTGGIVNPGVISAPGVTAPSGSPAPVVNIPSSSPSQNKDYFIAALNKYQVTDPKERAAMAAVVYGESGFKPQSETSYAGTSNARIRSIFGSRLSRLSEDQLTQVKADPVQFFDTVYGGRFGNGPDEGYKYRGRGLIQLTFKGNYEKFANITGFDLVGNPDLANDPAIAAEIAVKYMKAVRAGGDTYTSIARGVGNAVASTEAKKVAAYNQFLQSGEFGTDKVGAAGAPQVAQATETAPQNPGAISAPGAAPPTGMPPAPEGAPQQTTTVAPGAVPGAPQQTTGSGSSAPTGDIVGLGKWLQEQGIRVSENPAFGGVNPVHRGRGHYENRAIDVNAGVGIVEANDPVWGPRFDDVAAKAKAAGYTVIWRSAGHYNHMHIEIPAGGAQAAAQPTMPQAAPPPPTAPSMMPQRPANQGIAVNESSRGATIQENLRSQAAQVQPIVLNNTQIVNNTRTITRSQSSVPRASDGFDPLATVAAVAGIAIGKGLRGLF